MPIYRVEWYLELEAQSHEGAAREAQKRIKCDQPGYWVGTFSVIEHDTDGKIVQVDLDCLDQKKYHT